MEASYYITLLKFSEFFRMTLWHASIPQAPTTAARADRKVEFAQSSGPAFLPVFTAVIGTQGTGACHRPILSQRFVKADCMARCLILYTCGLN